MESPQVALSTLVRASVEERARRGAEGLLRMGRQLRPQIPTYCREPSWGLNGGSRHAATGLQKLHSRWVWPAEKAQTSCSDSRCQARRHHSTPGRGDASQGRGAGGTADPKAERL